MSEVKTITITEGLCELKLIDAKINKEIASAKFGGIVTGDYVPAGHKDIAGFETAAKASKQRITDLCEQYKKFKSAIVASNAVAKVTIGNKTYTVAEAIERKTSIQKYELTLLDTMKKQFVTLIRTKEAAERELQSRTDEYQKQTISRDTKISEQEVNSIVEGFKSRNKIHVIDPLKLDQEIDALDNEIQEFLSNVDVQLTISNSTTMITV